MDNEKRIQPEKQSKAAILTGPTQPSESNLTPFFPYLLPAKSLSRASTSCAAPDTQQQSLRTTKVTRGQIKWILLARRYIVEKNGAPMFGAPRWTAIQHVPKIWTPCGKIKFSYGGPMEDKYYRRLAYASTLESGASPVSFIRCCSAPSLDHRPWMLGQWRREGQSRAGNHRSAEYRSHITIDGDKAGENGGKCWPLRGREDGVVRLSTGGYLWSRLELVTCDRRILLEIRGFSCMLSWPNTCTRVDMNN